MLKDYQPVSDANGGKEILTGADAVQSLDIPSGARLIYVTVEGDAVRYWLNDATPTSSEGHEAIPGKELVIEKINCTSAQFYMPTGSTLHVSYFI